MYRQVGGESLILHVYFMPSPTDGGDLSVSSVYDDESPGVEVSARNMSKEGLLNFAKYAETIVGTGVVDALQDMMRAEQTDLDELMRRIHGLSDDERHTVLQLLLKR